MLGGMPALLTNTSTGATAARDVVTASRSVTSKGSECSFAEIRCCGHRPVGLEIVDVDVSACVDQHPGDAEADTPARAGDENSAIGEVEHEPAP